ncbi:MAG: CRISPR-associated endonuclease Cas2 [Bacteroidales bacterium]|nr:CRISPR-associated endonuclease Cas2 [Bacteroidales bacterium]
MSQLTRLNQYRIMWLIVFFDLPTDTKRDKKNYRLFRENLLKDVFAMFQFSIYVRHCASRENAQVHQKRVKSFLPPHGHVVIMMITDKQFGMIEIFYGNKTADRPEITQQLTLF